MSDVSDRLTKARKLAGFKTAAEAARALRVKPPTYYSHENGSVGVRAEVADVYARKFKVSVDWLLFDRGPMSPDTLVTYVNDSGFQGLPLVGSIQAGHWLETTDAPQEAEPEMVPIVRDPRFPHARQYALMVVGNSMDLDYPDGSMVTCVDYAESGLQLVDGMLLHVERQRMGGQLIEVTLKAVEKRRNGIWLVPHSTDPRHQAIALNASDPDTQVLARGVVTGGWRAQAIPGAR